MLYIQLLVSFIILALSGHHVSGLKCYDENLQELECDALHGYCMVLSMPESSTKRSCSTYIGCKGAELVDKEIISKTWNKMKGFLPGEKDPDASISPVRCCSSDLCNGPDNDNEPNELTSMATTVTSSPMFLLIIIAGFWGICILHF